MFGLHGGRVHKWPDHFLWQLSSELDCNADGACLYNPPGVKFDMDVNVFFGNRDALAAAWAGTPKALPVYPR
jgi:hypothetical protein